MAFNAGTSALTAIGPVNNAAFGLAARTWLASGAGQSSGATVDQDLDLRTRIVLGQLHAYLRTGGPGMTIAAVIAIGAATGLPPGTTRGLTIGAIQAEVTRRTGTAACIH